MTTLAAHLIGNLERRKSLERLVIVDDPDAGAVRVRWFAARPEVWRCSECGPKAKADCPHTFAAALVLAELLLGLTALGVDP